MPPLCLKAAAFTFVLVPKERWKPCLLYGVRRKKEGGDRAMADHDQARRIISRALRQGVTNLSERDSKALVECYGLPVNRGILVEGAEELSTACRELGYPLVIKAGGPGLAHKTEQGLVHVGVGSEQEAEAAFQAIVSQTGGPVLVQEMVRGQRELMMGLIRDPQFGPCVMFGLGGILAEVLEDVTFRLAPLESAEARVMMGEIRGRKALDSVRGLPAANLDLLAEMLVNLGHLGMDHPEIREIDLNPVILAGSRPVVVDALVVLAAP